MGSAGMASASRGRCSGSGTASASPLEVACEAPEPSRLKGDCASFFGIASPGRNVVEVVVVVVLVPAVVVVVVVLDVR